MRIACPNCGLRDAAEFTYLGDASAQRPADAETDLAVWNDFVFNRADPMGAHLEHWHHTAGCRAVLKVERDTLTHAIASVSLEGPWR